MKTDIVEPTETSQDPHGLTDTALAVLEKRYFRGEEDWGGLCKRVSKAVANGDTQLESKFYQMLLGRTFLPNSPCLMNAGRELGQLSACFVLGVEDSMESIFSTLKDAALVFQSGGGVGYTFSNLRQAGAKVGSTNGVASGAISFMKVFDAATETIKQGGTRRGAQMGMLSVTHPEILDFIDCKTKEGDLSNFNISVAMTDNFMEAVEAGTDYAIIDPRTGKEIDRLDARMVFDKIVAGAWKNGEPGLFFIDRTHASNPVDYLGKIETTNPCGEIPLQKSESCNLGSINLEQFVVDKQIDWDGLRETVQIATKFLDNVMDVSRYPVESITEATLKTRKIGLGIMGLHDMLIQMEIPYGSEAGISAAACIMEFIQRISRETSEQLATQKGPFPAYDSRHAKFKERRNATLTTIAPTGTLSMIADCSAGCEPYFSIVMTKHVLDGAKFLMVNKHFERVARREGFFSEELMAKIAETGTVIGHLEIPEKWQEIFRTAQDIAPEMHIRMQAELQKYVCNSISKTINLPNSATKQDVAEAYLLAYKLGCKGLTVYRDGSRDVQVLYGKTNKGQPVQPEQAALTAPITQTAHQAQTAQLMKKELLDVETCERFRVSWKGNRLYIMVSLDDDEAPIEVFTKLPREAGINGDGTFNPQVLQERTSNWDTICRLTSLALRYGVPLEDITKQFEKSSYSMVDAAGILNRVLKRYTCGDVKYADEEEIVAKGLGTKCPDCNNMTVVYEAGCITCKYPGCGYTACG